MLVNLKVKVPSVDMLEVVGPHQRVRRLAFVIKSREGDEGLPNPGPSEALHSVSTVESIMMAT